jgi:Uma2 family endonuclease
VATTTKVPVEEYLSTSYRPDVEYVDGELQERNLGEIEHSEMIAAVLEWFFQRKRESQIRVLPDVRMQVSPTRYRVPDVCICSTSNTDQKIVTTPPLLVVEVLSPEDRIDRYQQRITDYRDKGIRGIWVLNPETRTGWDCSSGNWIESARFQLADSPVYLDLKKVYAE